MFIENLAKVIFRGGIITAKGLYALLKQSFESPVRIFSAVIVWFAVSLFIAKNSYHLEFLYWIWPSFFSGWVMHWLLSFNVGEHLCFLFFSGVGSWAFLKGLKDHRKAVKMKRSFEAIGLTDSFGNVPKLFNEVTLDEYREMMIFRADSIGVDPFESKRGVLEGIFHKKIAAINQGRNPAYIEIYFSTKELPTQVSLQSIESKGKTSPSSFFIGEAAEGILQADISDLPHLMIAGTTGGGKSVFFKQVLHGLLKSSDCLQMYLIDLKGGLEFSDFKQAPNVQVVKTAEDAVVLLESIEREMHDRFKLLEKKGHSKISTHRDLRDPIVIAIDEASVLYAKRSNQDADYDLVARAREVTDSIAKLGRAAGIHLILATQKVSKDTVETTIQENISARMCFRMNTLNGSLAVLGNKDAMDLPAIPGRGIWQNGSKQVQVQAPSITSDEIRNFCKKLEDDFDRGLRMNYGELVGASKPNPGLKNLLRVVHPEIDKEDELNA
jgi:archaellum biogenesis ATPase FlaH